MVQVLIDHQFKMNRSLSIAVAAIINNILGPSTAFNVDQAMHCKKEKRLLFWAKKETKQRKNSYVPAGETEQQ